MAFNFAGQTKMKHNDEMLRDDEAFPMPLRSPADDLIENREYINNDFDDVFGSAPGSPVFGDDEVRGNDEQSDIPRLKEKHETEGYRDGVTKGKGKSVQVGFDEGYGLGAVLGLKIGKILGVLEGIHAAICTADGDEWMTHRVLAAKLHDEARKELSTQSVFGSQWWGEDGIWKYDVPAEKDGMEVLFPDVGAAHPLVQKWEKIVDEEVTRWVLDLEIMDHDGSEAEEIVEERAVQLTGTEGKEVAAEPVSSSSGTFMGIPKKDLNW